MATMLDSILACKALMPAAAAGINSLYEAMHNAVPVVCLPINTDQPFNSRWVSQTKICLVMLLYAIIIC